MKKAVGVEFSPRLIRGVEVVSLNKVPQIKASTELVVERGVFGDNEVINPSLAAPLLRELWKKGKFSTRNAVVGVGNPKTIVRERELPVNAIKSKLALPALAAGEDLPINVETSVMDFWVTEEKPGSREAKGLLVATPREPVEKIMEAFKKAKLKLVAVDLIPFSLLRGAELSGAGVIVNVGPVTTSFTIFDDGIPLGVRFTPNGENKLVEAVQRVTGVDYTRGKKILHHIGVGGEGTNDTEDDVIDAVNEEANRIYKNIFETVSYYATEFPVLEFGSIVILGEGVEIPEFFGNLKKALVTAGFDEGKILLIAGEENLELPAYGLALWGRDE